MTVRLAAAAFRHWDTGRTAWSIEPGTFHLHLGPSSGDLPLSAAAVTLPA